MSCSIRIKYGSDTYAFASKNGNHYWFIVECPQPSFSRSVGMIADYNTRQTLYAAALSQGYTDFDFEKIRTFAPTKESRGSTKPYKTSSNKAPRVARENKSSKTVAKKSTLNQSIKLF